MDINKLESFKEQYFGPYYVPRSEIIKAYNENEKMKRKYCILKNTGKESSIEFIGIKGKIIW